MCTHILIKTRPRWQPIHQKILISYLWQITYSCHWLISLIAGMSMYLLANYSPIRVLWHPIRLTKPNGSWSRMGFRLCSKDQNTMILTLWQNFNLHAWNNLNWPNTAPFVQLFKNDSNTFDGPRMSNSPVVPTRVLVQNRTQMTVHPSKYITNSYLWRGMHKYMEFAKSTNHRWWSRALVVKCIFENKKTRHMLDIVVPYCSLM